MVNTQTTDITQQVTSPTPATTPTKNPKRVAAGKLVAETTRLVREAHKKSGRRNFCHNNC